MSITQIINNASSAIYPIVEDAVNAISNSSSDTIRSVGNVVVEFLAQNPIAVAVPLFIGGYLLLKSWCRKPAENSSDETEAAVQREYNVTGRGGFSGRGGRGRGAETVEAVHNSVGRGGMLSSSHFSGRGRGRGTE